MSNVLTPIDLSVIIVNYNSTNDLLECIESIYQTTKRIRFEVLVVDNHSDDQSCLLHVLSKYPSVKLITCDWNHGFAGANNIAMHVAKGPLLLLLNPDTIILEDAIEKLRDFIDCSNDIGMVGPLILTENGRVDSNCARNAPDIWTEVFYHTGLARKFPRSRIFGHYLMTYWDHRTTREVELISGACLMARRTALEDVGYMDEQFFLYCDDVEWCYRFRKAGYKILFHPTAKVLHKKGQSTQFGEGAALIIAMDSMYKYIYLYHGLFEGFMYRMIMFITYTMKGLSRLLVLRKSIFTYYNMLLWALGALRFHQDDQGHPRWRGAKRWI